MFLVQRRVRKQRDPNEGPETDSPSELGGYRAEYAWVLLGEPGAGKSTALKSEAEHTGGQYLRIDEFINLDPDPAWQGKTLFLDGLDEVRASGAGASLLLQLRSQLTRLGKPAFRIACRAADWNGAADRDDLRAATPDGKISVLSLEPLSEDDILTILQHNLGISDSAAFVANAKIRGVADLLANPQTLEMLAKAIHGAEWPGSRDDTYRLACEKLAEEHNQKHRRAKRDKPVSVDQILDAAGQLCAVMLLADRNGIATDAAGASERSPVLEDFSAPDLVSARQAIGSKLFRQDDVEERFQPTHRSVAEYLAARWLGRQIDAKGLPLPRLLSLLLGADGGVVAGLRGLFAWLAVHCQSARSRLIEADPLTVVIYGDVKPMSAGNKLAILKGLRREAEKFSGFRRRIGEAHRFGALADPALPEEFRKILQASERDDASQTMVDCVLDVLDSVAGQEVRDLAPDVLDVARDESRWGYVRTGALSVWLKWADAETAVAMLEDVHVGKLVDAEDELAGRLLSYLFPASMSVVELLKYLHLPKRPPLFGAYKRFWAMELPLRIDDSQLPVLLDQLAQRNDLKSDDPYSGWLNRLQDQLLDAGVRKHGSEAQAERLFNWLGIGEDKYGRVWRENDSRLNISKWLEAHPEKYLDILEYCFDRSTSNIEFSKYQSRLHSAKPPAAIGLWHLEKASKAKGAETTRLHLREMFGWLAAGVGADGLSLETIESWANTPERSTLVASFLSQEWAPATESVQHVQMLASIRNREARLAAERCERTNEIRRHLHEIQAGTASPGWMNELAGVWFGLYTDVSGDTPEQRFASYVDGYGIELHKAAEEGFRQSVERADLPSPGEIFGLHLQGRQYLICSPCLAGMDLLLSDGSRTFDDLSDDVCRKMIAFKLTDGFSGSGWFDYLATSRPGVFSEILISYITKCFQANKEHVSCVHNLVGEKYAVVATLSLFPILEAAPIKAPKILPYLLVMMKVALRIDPDKLRSLCKIKIDTARMDPEQKVYWLGLDALLSPSAETETKLLSYVARSSIRSTYLASFFNTRFDREVLVWMTSPTLMGRLVESITPHALISFEAGWVSDERQRGQQVLDYIERLASMSSEAATNEINRLLGLPSLKKLKLYLENARHQQAIRRRESSFRFPTLREAAQVLENGAPTSHADLAVLVLDHLDQIAYEIQHENDDGYAFFWNVENKKPVSHREENRCRDEVLRRLRARLDRLGISCEPEADYVRDKRADIQVSYLNKFKLPIEIKGYWHKELWTALRSQLIVQYTTAPLASGFGLYLILWFGQDNEVPQDQSGNLLASICMRNESGKKPTSPQELQQRLEAQLETTERDRVFVRVLDVSWH